MIIFRSCMAALILLAPAHSAFAQDSLGSLDWSGAYFGLTAGAVRSEGEAVRDGFAGALIELDVANGLFPGERDADDGAAAAGLGVGYTFERAGLVAGLELDVLFTDSEASEQFSRIDPNPAPLFNGVITRTSYSTEIDSLATLRLRAGVARGRSFFYGTGGLAAGDVTNRFGLDLPNLSFIPGGYRNSWSEDGIRFGYVIGAGIEHRLSRRTSAKVEFLHFDLEDVTIHAEDPPVFNENTIDYRFKNQGQILRVGLNIRF